MDVLASFEALREQPGDRIGPVGLGQGGPARTDAGAWPSPRPAARRGVVAVAAMAGDAAGLLAGLLLATVVAPAPAGVPGGLVAGAVAVWLLTFAAAGLYDRSRLADASTEARGVWRAGGTAGAACVVATWAVGHQLDRSWALVAGAAALAGVGLTRSTLRTVVHRLQAQGRLGVRTVVVGTNDEARRIARTLARECWVGYRPAGFVAAGGVGPRQLDGLPVLGTLDDLTGTLRRAEAEAVVVATTALDPRCLGALSDHLQALDVEVRLSAGLPSMAASRLAIEPLDGLAMLSLRRNRLSSMQTVAKRAFDLVAATAVLVVALPVMAAVAVAIRVTSGPGVLFRQARVGEGGRPFTIYKFRTMVTGAEHRVIDLRGANEADGLLFKLRDDPRVTAVGRHLRRWGLDELPQLFNVLRGDMSLVGPRPPLPAEVERYDEWVAGRLRVKPGITGLWQVSGRHELSFDDYVRYDLFYVENWSLALDLFIVLRTLPALLSRRGAY